MILVRITMSALPEKQKEVMQTLSSMIEPTEKEAGCRRYIVLCDIEDNGRFSLLEEWETREDLDQHLRTNRFSVLLGIKALLCEPLNIQILTIDRSEGMEAVVSARSKGDN